MLKIIYIPDFKEGQPFLVITGDKAGFLRAATRFHAMPSGLLNDNAITDDCDLRLLESGPLYLTEKECKEIASHFENIVAHDKPGHIYMDIASLGDVEAIITYKEYDSL